MWLQACLNGSRTSTEHSAVPLTPDALADDARFLLTLTDVPWLRLLLEPWESHPEQANMVVDTIEDVLGDALPQVPRLVHGTDEAVWPLLERAMRSEDVSRIGLEDTLLLPTGKIATDNEALVRAAKAMINPRAA